MSSKFEELVNTAKINELLRKKHEGAKKKHCFLKFLAVVGVIATIAAIAYAVYRYFTPDYLEDFEDDFEDEDDFDDDFFEDDEDDLTKMDVSSKEAQDTADTTSAAKEEAE